MQDRPPPHDPRSDEQLIDAINRGDDRAFEALYYRYRDWVINLAYRTMGDREAALDVMQETFAYLLRKTPNLELTAKMTTFLFPVVRHLAIAARKKSARFVSPSNDLPDPPVPADNPDDAVESPREALGRVMAGLSETHREVVLLRFVDDLSLAEIAQAMDVPVGTIKSRLHHALKALQDDEATRKYFEM